uniref:Putative cytosol aminopeptidase n=1 Tax=Anthurium amnicola TaxID=1678845 RepID=A0A1D1Y8N4_9ARAE
MHGGGGALFPTPPTSLSRPTSLFVLFLHHRHPRSLLSIHLAMPMSSSSASGGRRPKKRVYHRVPDLDKVMDLQKKPALILRLRDLILARQGRPLLLRDLEKEVGFVKKWDFVSLIQKHPSIFRVSGGGDARAPISVGLTEKADKVSGGEAEVRELMEPILVRRLRKLLMMSMDCQVPLAKVDLVESELGLPRDFKRCLIPKYPGFFSVRSINGLDYLCLESWDSSLAVTAREERLKFGGDEVPPKGVPRDGNYLGPFSFRLSYPPGFRPNKGYLEEVLKWQKMAFPSPYLNARSFDPVTAQARKRAVAVLHELLSLMMEKRLTSDKLDAFHNEYQLPFIHGAGSQTTQVVQATNMNNSKNLA